MSLTLTSYSTARFATWWFVDEWGLLFDCGDGAAAGLAAKGGKVKTIAITHADRDHLSGLLQFLQLHSRGERPHIFYPADCGSFPALADFSLAFDPQQGGKPTWLPVHVGDCLPVGKGRYLEVLPNDHIEAAANQTKSVSYRVFEERRRLRPEHVNLSGPEIGALKQVLGEDAVTTSERFPLLGYSGDSAQVHPEYWSELPVLIHEATFLGDADAEGRAEKHRHCLLPNVLEMAATLELKTLVLGHISTRYHHERILEAVAEEQERVGFAGRVELVLPGQQSVIALP